MALLIVAPVAVMGGCTALVLATADQSVEDRSGPADAATYRLSEIVCTPTEETPRASGTITNTSDRERSYRVLVEALDPDHPERAASTNHYVSLDPGESDEFVIEQLGWESITPPPDFDPAICRAKVFRDG